jgi:hypothetical protein
MKKPLDHTIVSAPKLTELQQFAQWFHKDWHLVFREFYSGAALYLKQLPTNRRRVLHRELRAFLDANAKVGPHVLSICVEVSSAAMYLDDDPGVLISACLFGDGAGAAVLS